VTDAVPLGPGAEFDAIRRMADRWGARASGLGDDAALLRVPRGDVLVASVDSAVEGTHFKREWLSAREICYRSVDRCARGADAARDVA
jgi:thiamine-monophosphate kinase